MKALTVCQPYAELIASGAKRVENREWSTSYRGPLLIHAGKSTAWLEDPKRPPEGMVFGAVVAVATVVACLPKGAGTRTERAQWGPTWADLYDHEHAHGTWCWVLEGVVRLRQPVPWRGAQGLWVPPEDLVKAVWSEWSPEGGKN